MGEREEVVERTKLKARVAHLGLRVHRHVSLIGSCGNLRLGSVGGGGFLGALILRTRRIFTRACRRGIELKTLVLRRRRRRPEARRAGHDVQHASDVRSRALFIVVL